MLAALLLSLQAVSPSAQSTVRPAPRVTPPRLEAEAVIDGVLDEPAWREAARLADFRQFEPVDGRPAEERTEVLVWYSPNAIYFGILAYDRQPETIRATQADRDNLGSDDRVTIYLDTFNDRRRAFFFTVNPLGAQEDGVRTEGAVSAGSIFGGTLDRNPDFRFESRGRVTAEGYMVEVRIPFKSLRYPSAATQRWGLNVVRQIQRTGYRDTWTDVRRANASFLAQAGFLEGLHGLQRGIVVEVQPFATATANGRRDSTGAFARDNIDPSAGVNLRLGLTNLSFDGTYNPDFSQVESDAGQVTLNQRFALFFPEKRPFFLEGIELFATPNQLVYTRRIADPIGGAKVTGKFGRWGLAHLTAVDEVPTGDDALVNVTRVRRDLGSNSIAGLTLTDRSAGGSYNRVVAGDSRIVFGKLYYVEAQLGGSWTREGGVTTSAPTWKAEFDRTGRSWGFNYRIDAFGADFVTRNGFVPRNDLVQAHAFNRLTWYGGRGAALENFTTFFGPTRLWRYADFGSASAIEGAESISFNTTWRGGWQVNTSVRRDFFPFEAASYADYEVDRGGGVVVPYQPAAEATNLFGLQLSVATPTFRAFNASLSLGYGEAATFAEAGQGNEFRASGSLTLRPTASIRLRGSATVLRLTRARDGSEFARSVIPRVQLEFQPNKALFFRFIGEYRSERQAALADPQTGDPILVGGIPSAPREFNGLRADWLVSYEPTPGTVAFLGYGASLAAPSTFGLGDLRRTTDGFFVKLAYLFRR